MKINCLLILLLFSTLPSLSCADEVHPSGGGEFDFKNGRRKMFSDGVMKIDKKVIGKSVIDRRFTRIMHEWCKKGGIPCPVKSYDGDFVAFNADYHAPRHHPPKNN